MNYQFSIKCQRPQNPTDAVVNQMTTPVLHHTYVVVSVQTSYVIYSLTYVHHGDSNLTARPLCSSDLFESQPSSSVMHGIGGESTLHHRSTSTQTSPKALFVATHRGYSEQEGIQAPTLPP